MDKQDALQKLREQEQGLAMQVFPDLSKARKSGINLCEGYWSPLPGEIKRVFFQEIKTEMVRSLNPARNNELESCQVAYFVEVINGIPKLLRNMSTMLLSGLQSIPLVKGCPLEITHVDKVKGGNGLFYDKWIIEPLILETEDFKETTISTPTATAPKSDNFDL